MAQTLVSGDPSTVRNAWACPTPLPLPCTSLSPKLRSSLVRGAVVAMGRHAAAAVALVVWGAVRNRPSVLSCIILTRESRAARRKTPCCSAMNAAPRSHPQDQCMRCLLIQTHLPLSALGPNSQLQFPSSHLQPHGRCPASSVPFRRAPTPIMPAGPPSRPWSAISIESTSPVENFHQISFSTRRAIRFAAPAARYTQLPEAAFSAAQARQPLNPRKLRQAQHLVPQPRRSIIRSVRHWMNKSCAPCGVKRPPHPSALFVIFHAQSWNPFVLLLQQL